MYVYGSVFLVIHICYVTPKNSDKEIHTPNITLVLIESIKTTSMEMLVQEYMKKIKNNI